MPLFYSSIEINNFVIRLARYRIVLNREAGYVDLAALSVIVFEIPDLACYLEPLACREVGLVLVEAQNPHHLDVSCTACICLSLKDESASLEFPQDNCLADEAYSLAVIAVHVVHCISIEKTEVFCSDVAGILTEVKGKMVFEMMKKAVLLFLTVMTVCSMFGGNTITNLRTLGLESPLGVESKPVFSWEINATDRGVTQGAYEIVVSEADGGAVVWNSGVLEGSNQTNVVYGGTSLKTRTKYDWTVRVFAFETSQVGGLFKGGSVYSYEIDFIERPGIL